MSHINEQRESAGPVFIIGMPRSGTKLLRDLLNRNPYIGIPEMESNFIPFFIRKYGSSPGFENQQRIEDFYRDLTTTNFFWNMANVGKSMPLNVLYSVKELNRWSSVFEAIFRYYAPDNRSPDFIWGDKTPIYIQHAGLLHELFPKAKFVHIVRDPRDYVLSVENAWGKNGYRAAQDWQTTLSNFNMVRHRIGISTLEVQYEKLLNDPENVLTSICNYLGCDFHPSMIRLERPTENLGAAQDMTTIKVDNANKYMSSMGYGKLKRIEEIVYPEALRYGYSLLLAAKHRSVGQVAQRIYTSQDAIASLRFHIREKGLNDGVRYIFRFHSQNSWIAEKIR